jgi:hypothetical protein
VVRALARAVAGTLSLALAMGVAACTAATPSSTPSAVPVQTTTIPPPTLPAGTSTAPSVAPSREPAGDLGREIEIKSLERSWTAQMLEFASDGESILYSSGAMDGSDGNYAPDLWRYHPSTDEPELLWRNPRRDRSLVKIGGEFGTSAFVDMPLGGEVTWDFWLIPEAGEDPILLDSHPGAGTISDFVPSFHVHQDQVAWTAFDFGSDGEALSRLLYARAPDWTPVVVAERDARLAELWFPSLRDTQLAYCEVIYSADRTTDERHVYVVDAAHLDIAPRRLDTSGRATMPILLINGGVVWKEADPGFSMFNWGTMYHYDEETGEVIRLPTRPQEYVNYPSAGARFITAWGADTRAFGVYDLDLDITRLIDRWPAATNISILRPHNSWELLVWLEAEIPGDDLGQVRFAFLPSAGTDRNRD